MTKHITIIPDSVTQIPPATSWWCEYDPDRKPEAEATLREIITQRGGNPNTIAFYYVPGGITTGDGIHYPYVVNVVWR